MNTSEMSALEAGQQASASAWPGDLPAIVWLASAWLLGTVLASAVAWPALAWMAAGLLAATVAARRQARTSPAGLALLLAACLCLGAARYRHAQPDLEGDHVAALADGPGLTLRCRIVAEPDRRDRRTDYRLRVEARWLDEGQGAQGRWKPLRGIVLAQLPPFPPHAYGETVILEGRLERPPQLEGFDYQAYLARKGIHAIARRPRLTTVDTGGGNPVRRLLIALRERGRLSLAASLPEPEAALATGILLGDARRIPAAVDDAFRLTNTSHVIAISGSNISLLVVLLLATLGRWLGPRRAFPAIISVLALYSALVGADAAVVRAAIMGGLMVLAGHLGRPGDAGAALMAAAWVMSLWNPMVLWDLGFQLSFAATAGLIAFSSRFGGGLQSLLEKRVEAGRARALVRLINEAVLVTLAAQLTTWPIIAWQLGQVSVTGLVANFLILPAQPALMGLAALSMAGGMLWVPAGRALGLVAWIPLAWTIRVVELFAALPMASVGLPLPGWAALGYYLALAIWLQPAARDRLFAPLRSLLAMQRRQIPLDRLVTGWRPHGPLLAATSLIWLAAFHQPDGLLHLYQLDVGQGDAILIVTPNGQRMLVDGGPSPSALLDALGRQLPPWDRRLDVVLLTHPDGDHVGGLPVVLERYEVGVVIDPELEAETPDAAAWAHVLAGAEVERVRAGKGGRIVLDSAAGVTADMLWPPEPRMQGSEAEVNNNSVVLMLRHGQTRMLLTGDIEAEAEAALLDSGVDLRAGLLKVAHHGSEGSSTADFVAAVAPRLALIGVGADNRYGHPAEGALGRLAPALVRRTDRDGTIEVISDGIDLWLR